MARRALSPGSCRVDVAGCAASGTIGGAYYDPAYDYSEFFAVTDGRNFQVVMAGAPFPQPAGRRGAERPAAGQTGGQQAPAQPHLRRTSCRGLLPGVLVFDAANDLTASVCAGTIPAKNHRL